MDIFHRAQWLFGRLALAGLAMLLVLALFSAKPWAPAPVALRPDTGSAAAALDDAAVEAVLSTLLVRVYEAFEEEEEGAIYDGLAQAVASGLLTDLYLQRRGAQLRAPPETAGSAEINSVELNDLTVLERGPAGYVIDADWTVTGLLGHEDHQHERVNRYAAKLTLGPSQNEWRLTRFDLNQVRREDKPLFLDPFK